MRTARIVSCAALVVVLGPSARAQTPAPAQTAAAPAPAAFDVASVKPSAPHAPGPLGALPIMRPAGSTLIASNVPLRLLVRIAYQVEDFQISGGPSWQMSQTFDINAKMPNDAPVAGTNIVPMLKTLLADRFKLKTHVETREMPVYALVLTHSDGTLGPEMKTSTSDCPDPEEAQKQLADTIAKKGAAAVVAMLQSGEPVPCSMLPALGTPGQFALRANGQPIVSLAKLLTTATGRIVQDKTGLTGLYDWTLSFDPQVLMALVSQIGINLPPGASLPPSDSPSLLTAIQEQLGLKLESARGPVDVLVIDSAEMPEAD
jgi:uncharacterized protein (TIGR03435 family)